MLYSGLEQLVRYGERLDTPLVGAEYFASPQKFALDYYGSRLLFGITAPIVRAARIAVRAEDGGPTIVALPRLGKDSEVFKQLKVRSMVKGSEADRVLDSPKSPDDPRITKVGRFLREHSIDEMPQFRNVMNGEMSLVGPRPRTLDYVESFGQVDPEYLDAYTGVLPGVTGLEQVNGRGLLTSDEIRDYAVEYASEGCLAMDLDILMKTAGALTTPHGAY